MDKQNKIKYILYISIFINIVFFVNGLQKASWKYFQRKKNKIEKLSEVKNIQQDSLLVDKKILYSENTGIILTFGQSNSANSGQGTYKCHNEVFNYFNGNLYKANEPLLGATGDGCSVWTRLADMLIDSGLYKKVVLIPIGIGSTSIDCWANDICNEKLIESLEQIQKDSIKITHIIWHQGESDNIENTAKDVYKAKLKKILLQIRAHGIKANFYVCVASYHPYVMDKFNGVDSCIQSAQIEFAKENKGTKLGPNTDLINLAADRWDGVHFSKRGLDKFAKELYDKIKE